MRRFSNEKKDEAGVKNLPKCITGRISSNKPRFIEVARIHDSVVYDVDYSEMEKRVAAHMGEETWLEQKEREGAEIRARATLKNLACNDGPGTSCKGYDHEAQQGCRFYESNRTNSACYWRVLNCYLCGNMKAQLDCRNPKLTPTTPEEEGYEGTF